MDVSKDWDHPMVRNHGLIPQELAMEFFEYTSERGFKSWYRRHPDLCKVVNRKYYLSAKALDAWLASPPGK